jgi:two-component system KDP operon response regulator KdpE
MPLVDRTQLAPPVPRATILLVEDDDPTRSALATAFAAHGHAVVEAVDLASGMAAWDEGGVDLVILDLGLPDGDGLSLLQVIRATSRTPVLVLTARDAERDKVQALDAGADDHVSKPFGMAELRARVRALLRRVAEGPVDDSRPVVNGPLVVDAERHRVEVSGRPVVLTPREFAVLRVLAEHPGRVITHGRILRAVWGPAYDAEAHYLHVYVSQIRRKLAAADPDGLLSGFITAEPGVGYRVEALPPAGPA